MGKNKQKNKIPVSPLPSPIVPGKAMRPSVSFSFKYIDQTNGIFNLQGQTMRYVHLILEKLKSYSNFTIPEMISNGSKALRCHPIRWEDTSQKGFPVKKELYEGAAYQFSIMKSRGRIAGFIIKDIFYIVWVDPHHKLYP